MTNKKPLTSKPAPADRSTTLDAATLSNMAHKAASIVASGADIAALQPIAEMLAKLSPANLQMVANIIRVIVDEQSRDGD